MFLGHHLAGGSDMLRLAPQHHLRGSLWSPKPPHHLPRHDPNLRSTPGGGQPGQNLCQQHEARQGFVLITLQDQRKEARLFLQRKAFALTRTVHVCFMWRYPEMSGTQYSEKLFSKLCNKKVWKVLENGFHLFC